MASSNSQTPQNLIYNDKKQRKAEEAENRECLVLLIDKLLFINNYLIIRIRGGSFYVDRQDDSLTFSYPHIPQHVSVPPSAGLNQQEL